MNKQKTVQQTQQALEDYRRPNGQFGTQPLDRTDVVVPVAQPVADDYDEDEAILAMLDDDDADDDDANRSEGEKFPMDDEKWDQLMAKSKRLSRTLTTNANDADELNSIIMGKVYEFYDNHPEVNPFGLVNRIGKRNMLAVVSNMSRVEDARAMRQLNQECSKRSQKLGRDVTEAERAEIAQEIIAQNGKGSHPISPDFYLPSAMTKMMWDDGGVSIDEKIAHSNPSPLVGGDDGHNTVLEPDSAAAMLLAIREGKERIVDDEGNVIRSDAATMFSYAAMAEVHNGHRITPGSVSHRVVSQCRETIKSYPGGVAGACQAWLDGTNDEGTKALFRVFEEDGSYELPRDEREKVCDILCGPDYRDLDSPAKVETLFDSACQMVNKRNLASYNRIVKAYANTYEQRIV